uniref:Genome polyprotein n=1 Tax=Chinese broad-headed pond turtle hepacivirus TaxID=2116372 RepID=A0A2P1GMR2_9FLAV|nr:polyprotein [Chinese broad-headed pond turtle hepacivirus]
MGTHNPIPYRLARTIDRCAKKGWFRLALSLILKARPYGIYFYAHCGHIPPALLRWLRAKSFISCDPVTAVPETSYVFYDPDGEYWCGSGLTGRPVTHRRGNMVRVGVDGQRLSRSWKRAAPKRARRAPQQSTVRKSAEPGDTVLQMPQVPRPAPQRQARVRVAGSNASPLVVKQSESWVQWWHRHSTGQKIDYFDPAVQFATDWGLPMAKTRPYDPRVKSRNFGRIIDGFWGWASDVAYQVPVVGGIFGGVGRGIGKCFRFVEDVINLVTTPMGFSLFFLTLLTCVSAQGTPAGFASHICRMPNGTHFITNACRTSEISFCSEHLCWHRHGCVPCVGTSCWKRLTHTVSSSKEYNGVAWDLARYADAVVTASYVCEALWMGEACAGVLLVSDWVIEFWGHQHVFNECCVCSEVGAERSSTFFMFFSGLASQTNVLGVAMDLLTRLPNAILSMFVSQHWGFLGVGLAYFLDGRTTRVFVLIFVYILIVPTGAIPTLHPRCNRTMDGTKYFITCYDPYPTRYITPHGKVNYTNLPYAARNTECHFLETGNFKLVHVCQFRGGRQGCGKCLGDCFTKDPKLTYQRCGVGPWLTPDILVWHPSMRHYYQNVSNWLWSYLRVWGKVVDIRCRPTANYSRLVRMPFVPYIYSTTTAYACPGYATIMGEVATGFVMVTPHGTRQLIAGERIVSNLPILEHNFLLLCLLHMCGSRILALFWFLFMVYTAQGSIGDSAVAVHITSLLHGNLWVSVLVWALVVHKPAMLQVLWPCVLAFAQRWLLCVMWLLVKVHTSSFVVGAGLSSWAVPTPLVSLSEFFCISVLMVSSVLVTCTPGMKKHRATALWVLAYLRERFALFVHHHTRFSCTKEHLMVLFAVLVWWHPTFFCELMGIVFFLCAVFDLLWACYVHSLRSKLQVYQILRILSFVDRMSSFLAKLLVRFTIHSAAAAGIYLYDHLHQVTDDVRRAVEGFAVTMDPVLFHETEIKYIVDSGQTLACGDVADGLPIVARLGDMVVAGYRPHMLEGGWRLCAPLVVTKHDHRSTFSVMAISLTGMDKTVHEGQVCRLGTALTTSMGFGFAGSLITTRHGSRCRGLASAVGSTVPIADDPTNDVAIYPLPQGMGCLSACDCSTKDFWFLDRHGELRSCTRSNQDNWYTVYGSAPLNVIKGASGGPLMCSAGHAVGMLTQCRHVRSTVNSIFCLPLSACVSVSPSVPLADMSTPPVVPATYGVYPLYAPTGHGKSTKIPAQYVNAGFRVAVLNPSVATTSAMGPYMAEAYRITPNVYYGETSVTTGSALTYATYGKYLAMGDAVLQGADVVICDECHATDATSVLGIATVLSRAKSCGVRCVILATATPPGIPLTKHSSINEVALDSEGTIPFYGKTLRHEQYLVGRHLIFCSSKEMCKKIRDKLRDRGCNAVAYWRGIDKAVIPLTGDCVVVSTDALMTGYTGNFDSVTDCGVAVVTQLTVDLAPTFSICLMTVQANTVTKMQRRGRTGRGSPGVYRYVDPHAAVSGIVGDATIAEVFDTAMSWYDLEPHEVTTRLTFYSNQPGLPVIQCNASEWEAVYRNFVRYNRSEHLHIAKQHGLDFCLLTAAQVETCYQTGSALPGTKGRWKLFRDRYPGVTTRLVCNLEVEVNDYIEDAPITRAVQAALGLERVSETSALLYVGAGLVACAIIIDNTASIVVTQNIIIGTHELMPAGLAAEVYDVDYAVLEEASASLPYEWCRTHFGVVVEKLTSLLKSSPTASENWLQCLTRSLTCHLGNLLGSLQLVLGLATLSHNPVIGAACAFTASFLATLPVKTKIYLSIAGGSIASRLASVRPACAFALAGVAGSLVSASSWGSALFGILASYGASTEVASLVYGILTGNLPSMDELAGLVFAVLNPGAAVVGAVCAVLLYVMQRKGDPAWTNRLLAMCAKTSVIPPNFFVETQTLTEKVHKVLKSLTLTSTFNTCVDYLQHQENSDCASSSFPFPEIWASVLRLFKAVKSWLGSKISSLAPKVPYLNCQTGWSGSWTGTGIVHTTCTCGVQLTYDVRGGKARFLQASSRLCSNWLLRRVPININTRYTGGIAPMIDNWTDCTVMAGIEYLFYHRDNSDIFLTGSTCDQLIADLVVPETQDISFVSGVCVSRLETGFDIPVSMYRNSVTLGALRIDLPQRCYPRPVVADDDVPSTSSTPFPSPGPSREPSVVELIPMEPIRHAAGEIFRDFGLPGDRLEQMEAESCDSLRHPLSGRSLSSPPPSGRSGFPRREQATAEWVHGQEQRSVPSPPSTPVELRSNCSYSYVWNGVPAWVGKVSRKLLPVRISTVGLSDARPAYYTQPSDVERRIAKVTTWRSALYTPSYYNFLAIARRKAAALRTRELTYSEVSNVHSASSDLTGLTSAEVRAGTRRAKKLVQEALEGITQETSRFRYTTLMPKSEIFVRTPTNPGMKPPRLIVYPPLELRVAEKIVMGDVAPRVVKTILGDAYGFQYSPVQRTKFLVRNWVRRQNPVGIACDTICFDSTVTPEDVANETSVYAAAATGLHKERIVALGKTLYTTSEVRNNVGQVIGHRYCRASGVYTTSTSNCLTVWLKVKSAMADAGIHDATLLVNGDDVVMIFESVSPESDKKKAMHLELCLRTLGMPQNSCKPVYSLDQLVVCSSNVSVANSLRTRRPTYYLTRDPTTPLGRALVETSSRTPVGSWLGYVLQHYPALWASRVIMVHWLDMVAQTVDYTPDTTITIEWSNTLNVQLRLLPYLLTCLHGADAMVLSNYTPAEISRTGRVLRELGYQPLKYWKRKAVHVRAQLLRKGGVYAYLARHLLWFAAKKLPPVLDGHQLSRVEDYLQSLPPPYSGIEVPVEDATLPSNTRWVVGGVVALLLVAFAGAIFLN